MFTLRQCYGPDTLSLSHTDILLLIGVFKVSSVIGDSTEHDGDSDWSVPLVIGLCCGAGIVLLIAIVVACVSVRRMMKKKYSSEYIEYVLLYSYPIV